MTSVLQAFINANKAVRGNDLSGAANYMRQLCDSPEFLQCEMTDRVGGFRVYAHGAMFREYAYVDQASSRIIVNPETWKILSSHQPAVDLLLTQAEHGAGGMRFLVADSGPYADAALRASRAAGTDVVRAKDAITDAEERIARLVTNATSLQGQSTTENQRRVLFEDYGRAKEDLDLLEKRLFDARAVFDLAGTLLLGIQ